MNELETYKQKGRTDNSQFAKMAGKLLRLNIFGKLKIRSSVEVYR